MPRSNARRALWVVGPGALVLLAIVANLAYGPSATEGTASAGAAPSPAPDWEQLMGRSVQARKAGAVTEARDLLEQAASLARTFDPHDMRRARTRMGEAEFHLWSGEPELAERAYQDAVSIGEMTAGPHDPRMVSLLEGLANFYYYRARYDDAVPIFRRILDIVRGANPYDAHEEARRTRDLARVHELRGRFAEATPLYLQALRLVDSSARQFPGEAAEYQQAAATCYLAWGKARLAEPLAARALTSVEGLAGPTALDVVPYLKTLADARLQAGKPASAARLYERAIAIVERNYGAGHSDLAPFLSGRGAALAALVREERTLGGLEARLGALDRESEAETRKTNATSDRGRR
jgi:tetratricopeptide (TPR) repeat protein